MKLFAPLAAVMLAMTLARPAPAAELTTGTQLGPPRIFLEGAEALQVQRLCRITLPAGETTLTMPLGALGVDPAEVSLEVVTPQTGVRVVAMEVEAQAPKTARWRLSAEDEVPVELRLSYPVKGIKWEIEYAVTVQAVGGLDMQAHLKLTNDLGRPLTDAIFALPGGAEYRASLEAGETVSATLLELTAPPEMVERTYIYDHDKLGDVPVEMLMIQADALRPPPAPITSDEEATLGAGAYDAPLPAGKARLFAPPEAGGDFIADTSIPYVPPHEPLELKVGPASGLPVTRTRTEAKEVNARQDAHRKTVLFDLDETYELKLRNLRRGPVELIIREHPQDTWQMLRAGMAHLKTDAHTVEFRVHLAPSEERTITYQVRRLNLEP